jgi:hypothetical protein
VPVSVFIMTIVPIKSDEGAPLVKETVMFCPTVTAPGVAVIAAPAEGAVGDGIGLSGGIGVVGG